MPVMGGGGSATTATKTRRLHALKIHIQLPRGTSEKYKKSYLNSITIFRGAQIQCFSESVMIQFPGQSFWGSTEEEAQERAAEVLYPLFRTLQHDFGIDFLKDRTNKIKMSYAERATTPSSTASEAAKRDRQIRIYEESGKLRFTTDQSMGFEHETHSAKTGFQDSKNYNKHAADFLDHPEAPTLSELAKIVGALATQNAETAAGLNAVVKMMQKPTLEPTPETKTRPPSYVL